MARTQQESNRMDRREMLKASLLAGGAVLLTTTTPHAKAEKFPTGGEFPASPPTKAVAQELRRLPIKQPLLEGVKDLKLPENGGVAPNGTVYPQVRGDDTLTTYYNSLDRIVALQQRNSANH